MKKDSGTAKHEENTTKEKVAKERESESESGIVTWCKGIVGIGLFKIKKKVKQLYSYLQIDMQYSHLLQRYRWDRPLYHRGQEHNQRGHRYHDQDHVPRDEPNNTGFLEVLTYSTIS